MSRRKHHVTIRARVAPEVAGALQAVATAEGVTMARLIEMAVLAVIEVAKKVPAR